MPALLTVLDKLELVAERELNGADAGRCEPQGIFRQGQRFDIAWLPPTGNE